jgi:hypothetical protein
LQKTPGYEVMRSSEAISLLLVCSEVVLYLLKSSRWSCSEGRLLRGCNNDVLY